MDPVARNQERGLPEADGLYLRRAEALMARRAELFTTAPMRSLQQAAAGGAGQQERPQGTRRTGGRQLSLPIARERGRRRARMVR
jgi:hypothetical protein